MHKLQIHLLGHKCNENPLLDILRDDDLLYSGPIDGEQHFDVDLPQQGAKVVLRHHGKRFGKQHIWDTKSEGGRIIQDRRIDVLDLSLDDISFKHKCQSFAFIQEQAQGEPDAPAVWDGQLNFNGRIELEMRPSPMNWLILLLRKLPRQQGVSYFSDHSKLFHYEEDLALISEIEFMLEKDEIR